MNRLADIDVQLLHQTEKAWLVTTSTPDEGVRHRNYHATGMVGTGKRVDLMPQCKMSNCREPALPTGKQYCAHHQSEYLRKQREYAAVLAQIFRLAGCTPDVVDGFDLRLAYTICIGGENDLIANRVACTQAVYGGVK